MPDLLLGIDVGTASTKGVLVAPDGRVLAEQVIGHGMEVPRPGWAEQDADAVWWHDLVTITRALTGPPYAPSDVAAVGVSAIGPCLLPLDDTGRPLRPGILYGVDTRATEEARRLETEIGATEVMAFSKMAFSSQAIGPKIVWLRQHEPHVWERARTLTTASAYLTYRLTGRHVMDRHTASHFMPLIDMRTVAWSERYAGAVAPLAMLPELGWSDELAGHVSDEAAAETWLPPGTPVAVGAVDALAEAVGVGAVETGDLMIMYGSTTFFTLVLQEPRPDPRVWTTAGAFEGQYLLAAGMATTGSLTAWVRDQMARELEGEQAYDALFAAAAAVPPGAAGLLVLPYFSGERTPINDPLARGVVAGLSLAHTRDHLFRAVLEGVAYGIRHNLEAFADLGAPIERIHAVGGGARGSTWLQITSDVARIEQRVAAVNVGASYGDAYLAGLASGSLQPGDITAWVRTDRTIRPSIERAGVYDRGYELYRRLYEETRGVVHALNDRGGA